MSQLSIDPIHRYATMRAHTATHLLHFELTKILPETKQAGSYVGPDELRFDFLAEDLLTQENLKQIIQTVNKHIENNNPVSLEEMSYDEALQSGAKAFFEEKYPERVRVVSIVGTGNPSLSSIELCGGTHVASTGEIGAFLITDQTTVAAGVKRIVALTGPKVAGYAQELQEKSIRRAGLLGVTEKQFDAKLEKTLGEVHETGEKIKKLTQGLLLALSWNTKEIDGFFFDTVWSFDICFGSSGLNFKEVVEELKNGHYEKSRLLVAESGQYALHHPQAKTLTANRGWKGGGSDDFVQGKDQEALKVL